MGGTLPPIFMYYQLRMVLHKVSVTGTLSFRWERRHPDAAGLATNRK